LPLVKEIRAVLGNTLYLVKRGEMKPFIKLMEKEGWDFEERNEITNALVFNKGDVTTSIGYRYYTRYYTIIYYSP